MGQQNWKTTWDKNLVQHSTTTWDNDIGKQYGTTT